MWYITLIMLVIIITLIRYINRRKRMLADQIKGPDGHFFIGMLPLILRGPEQLLIEATKVYRE